MSRFKPSRGAVASAGQDSVALKTRRFLSRPSGQITTTVVHSSEQLSSDGLPAPALLPERSSPARQFAFNCTLLFLYFRFSFVHEFISSSIHIDLHILIILGLLSYFAWFIAGNIFVTFQDRIAWLWTGFVAWLCFATVTSSWKGGSLAIVVPYIRTVFPLLLLIPAVIGSAENLKKALNVVGLAGTTTVLFGLVHRSFTQGRMDIGTDNSSIQDPNDFAAHVIMMLPAICFYMFAKERSIFIKVFGLGIVAAALLEIMSTGSRGGFVALLIMITYVIFTGSSKLRISLLVGLPLAGMLAFPFVPKESAARLLSVFNSSQASESAAESSAARRALFMESLKATARNPIFGVGPGVFADYQAGMAAEQHQKGMWHETHNGYTQISSECGIPALILYLTALVMTFKSLKRASRTNLPVIPGVARTLATMAVGFSGALIFLAQGYRFSMLVIGAFTIAIDQLIQRYQGHQELPQ